MARKRTNDDLNRLYYGDNLDVLRQNIADESVDLVYLDPPFNSNRAYSVLFKEKSGDDSQAQMEAFDDTWTWSHETEALYLELMQASSTPNKVKDALEAMRRLLGDNDVLAYLVMMAARLIELRRVLKPTGSLYLHCDPTASHYLKIVLDAIFGAENFRNEVVWLRTGAKGSQMNRLPSNHDVILSYGKSAAATWNEVGVPYDLDQLDAATSAKYSQRDPDGRRYQLTSLLHPEQGKRPNLDYEVMGVRRTWRWSRDRMEEAIAQGRVVQTAPGRVPREKRYLDEQKGRVMGDVWTDISPLNSQASERLGYPTQKPLSLLERIISASSNEGDVVLDPFCGCGTTVDAAQKLGRRWIGIDVTTLAVDLIDARLRHTYGEAIRETYEILGIPRDISGAQSLFRRSPFEFERWCVMMLDGQPNEKQVGDRGIDGVIRFPVDGKGGSDRVLVSVKGGATNPGHVRDLVGTVESQRAAMGVFVCMNEPTKGMVEAANHSGAYNHPANGQRYPKVQIISVKDLINGKRPNMPTALLPYFQAQRRYGEEQTEKLF
ncbi:DNA methyltransferase [Streptomyces phage Werner]|uniref:Methyltransferase n=1 Tax=Streptomyces phage Werner TaxID=2801898 RepID=A0A7U0GCW5_9CAUD|nr:DNA methyltransferase [Streptomyces phage Werner]QQO39663.1 methyltransferase [Streptomyces phage Hippo]QQV92869.1 methyltransferase [Streptomyces phage Werner]